MKAESKKIMIVSIVTFLVLLSVFSAIPFSVNAQSATTSTGVTPSTVTLNPANGAFPGQLVYYKWTGVPTNLVPPVYVTVYLNGSAYQTSEATYDAMNGVLTGSFTMPNAPPGTVFNVSFSYRDSANNYGTQTVSGNTTLRVGLAPRESLSDSMTSTHTYGSAQFEGDTAFDGWSVGNVSSAPSLTSGSGQMNLNVSNELLTGNYETFTNGSLGNPVTPLQQVEINSQAAFVSLVNYSESAAVHATTINVTAVDKGLAILSLPASDVIPTTFKFASSSEISEMSTEFYLNTTVSGVLVSFKFNGVYTSPITSPGTYTMPGSFVTVTPSTLTSLTGQFSATYDIHDFGFNGTDYYVNYTLSITFAGNYSYVSVNAQYLTSVYTNNTGNTSTFTKTITVNLQAGYSFTSKYVGLENPGIKGNYTFSFYNATTNTYVNDTYFTFADSTLDTIINGIPPIYFNETLNMIGFNRTVTGALNMTLVTNYFVQGVYAIAPAKWNFNMSFTFTLQSDDGKITVSGYLINTTYWVNSQEYNLEVTVTSSNGFGNHESTFNPLVNATLQTYYGYPKINYATFYQTYVGFTYHGQHVILTAENATIPVNFVLTPSTVGHYYVFNGTRLVTGLNETLASGTLDAAYHDAHFDINVIEVSPVIYGVTSTGYYKVSYSGYINANNTNSAIVFIEQTNYSTATITVQSTATDYTGTVGPYYTLQLEEIGWYVHDATFQATLTAGYNGYRGSLTINGAGSTVENITLTTGTSFVISGMVTNTTGFGTTVGGWYNATVSVVSTDTYYALYGGVFTGNYAFNVTFNVTKNTTTYPFFYGGFSISTNNAAVISELPYNTVYTFNPVNSWGAYLNITDNMLNVTFNNVYLTGTSSFYWSAYGINIAYEWYTGPLTIGVNGTWQGIVYPQEVTGSPELTEDHIVLSVNVTTGLPLENVSLEPMMGVSMSWTFMGYIGSIATSQEYYNVTQYLSGSNQTYLNIQNGGSNELNLSMSGIVTQNIKIYKYELTFSGYVDGITYVTDSITVLNTGKYYVMGTANSPYGSGTVTGYVRVYQHVPYVSTPTSTVASNDLNISVSLNIHVYFANGTQAYIKVDMYPPQVVWSYVNSYYLKYVHPVPYTYTMVTEKPNTGSIAFGSYKLEQGSGALIVTLSDEQVATIVTQLGDVVNISLSQLNAKVVGIWNTANETYAMLQTAYGEMKAKLSAIDANITEIKNGIATIQTDLGTIQTSLNNLDAKITNIQNGIATIQTDIGTIQTSLNNLNSKITNIQNGIATIQTDLGTIQTSLNNLDAKITNLQNNIATIQTDLGTIQTSLKDINAVVVSNAKGISDLNNSLVQIHTSLGDIKGIVTQIKDGVATIQTDLGTVQTDVNSIKTNTANTASSVNTTLYWQIGVLILVIITLALVAYVIVQVNKISKKSEVKEEEEETTEEE